MPRYWEIFYKDQNGAWKPVEAPSNYGTEKGIGNTVTFKPVITKALRLEVKLPEKNSSGLYEWEVE